MNKNIIFFTYIYVMIAIGISIQANKQMPKYYIKKEHFGKHKLRNKFTVTNDDTNAHFWRHPKSGKTITGVVILGI